LTEACCHCRDDSEPWMAPWPACWPAKPKPSYAPDVLTLDRIFNSVDGADGMAVFACSAAEWQTETHDNVRPSYPVSGWNPVMLTSPLGEVQSIVMSTSVCLSVCLCVSLFVCLLTWHKNHTQPNLTNFRVCLWPWLGPPLTMFKYIIFVRFSRYFMFSHFNLCMLYVFLSSENITAKTTASVLTKFLFNYKDQQVHIVGCRPGMKFAIYDCFVLFCWE